MLVQGKEVGFEIHVLLQYLIKIVTQCSSNAVSFSSYYFLKVKVITQREVVVFFTYGKIHHLREMMLTLNIFFQLSDKGSGNIS